MKLITLIAASLLSLTVYSGGPDSEDGQFFMNSHMEIISKEKDASYKGVVVEKNEMGYHVKAYFLSGELKMEGFFADEDLQVPSGWFTYYYQNGKVESMGEFKDGEKFGLWQRFDFEGNEKPEKIYATLQTMQAIQTFNQ
jgi:hypothetical protein